MIALAAMPDLTPELLLAALVVTSLATGGLLGLWAATSRWHWFARTMVVFAVLTPLLWRPIYEPFVTLLVEVAVVVLGVTIYRRNWPQPRFSIAGLLMLTVPVAMVVAAAVRSQQVEVLEWTRPIALGVLAAAITLLTVWLCLSPWSRWKRVGMLALALPFLAVGWYWANYVDDHISWFDLYGSAFADSWVVVKGSLWATLSIGMLMAAVTIPSLLAVDRLGSAKHHRWRKFAAAGAALAIATGPAYVAWLLSFPLPLPETVPPASPAYRELVSLAESPAFTRIERLDAANTIDWKAMRTAVISAETELERATELIAESLTIPYAFDSSMSFMDDVQARRSLAHIWDYRAELASRANDAAAATAACDTLLRLGHQLEGQGLLVDALVASAIEGIALSRTNQCASILDTGQLKLLAQQLAVHNFNRRSLEPMWERYQIYSENVYGWRGHLIYLLDYTPSIPFDFTQEEQVWYLQKRNATVSSLLAARLALNAFKQEKDIYPERLADLVPEYLPHVPQDPCSAEGEPLIYRPTDDGYLLYSRGFDGDDDLGRPCGVSPEFGFAAWTSDGDLTLEAYFVEDGD